MPDECKSCGIKDALVIFVTVEKEDVNDPGRVIDKGVEEIVVRAKEVGARALVLYPFVHLSEKIGPPTLRQKL